MGSDMSELNLSNPQEILVEEKTVPFSALVYVDTWRNENQYVYSLSLQACTIANEYYKEFPFALFDLDGTMGIRLHSAPPSDRPPVLLAPPRGNFPGWNWEDIGNHEIGRAGLSELLRTLPSIALRFHLGLHQGQQPADQDLQRLIAICRSIAVGERSSLGGTES